MFTTPERCAICGFIKKLFSKITEQKGIFCGFYTSKRAFLDSNNYFACAKLKVELEKR
jgi:hypothetical protein